MKNLNLDGEIWLDIEGYDGLYQVSNKGRVKSLKYGKEQILKPRTITKYKHQQVSLYKNGIVNQILMHRLVAELFLPNPDNKPEIDHVNTDPSNNCVENLRWVSHKENSNNPLTKIHCRDSNGGQPIYCFETDTTYQSTKEIKRQLNVNTGSVSRCCQGERKSAGGYHFCYADELPDTYELFLPKHQSIL